LSGNNTEGDQTSNEANLFVIDIDNIALQQIPEDDVLRELSKQVGNCAMQLGVELGLSMVETLYKLNFIYID
jgi:hypothetical protein